MSGKRGVKPSEEDKSNSTMDKPEVQLKNCMTAIRTPKLSSLSKEKLVEFRRLWKQYERRIEELRAQGVAATKMPVSTCLKPSLLDALVKYKLKAEHLTFEERQTLVEKYVIGDDLKPTSFDVAKRRLRALKMDVGVTDPTDRVMKLFEQYDLLIEELGVKLTGKKAVKTLANAVQPMALRKKILAELDLGIDLPAKSDVLEFYDFLTERVDRWSYSDDSITRKQPSGRAFKKPHVNEKSLDIHQVKSRTRRYLAEDKGCWSCGGSHSLAQCPRTGPRARRRIFDKRKNQNIPSNKPK